MIFFFRNKLISNHYYLFSSSYNKLTASTKTSFIYLNLAAPMFSPFLNLVITIHIFFIYNFSAKNDNPSLAPFSFPSSTKNYDF